MLSSKLRTAALTLATAGVIAVGATDAWAGTRAGAATAPKTVATTTVARISAFPANDGGNNHQAQVCRQWTNRLQADQGFTLQVDGSASAPQPNPQLDKDIDAAMDDGCVVIF